MTARSARGLRTILLRHVNALRAYDFLKMCHKSLTKQNRRGYDGRASVWKSYGRRLPPQRSPFENIAGKKDGGVPLLKVNRYSRLS